MALIYLINLNIKIAGASLSNSHLVNHLVDHLVYHKTGFTEFDY